MSFAMQATAPVYLSGRTALQAFVCTEETCLQRPGATRVLLSDSALSPALARVPAATPYFKPCLMELAEDSRNARAESSDSRYERYEAGFRDKFRGTAFVDAPNLISERSARPMEFLAHFIKPDLGGLEDWYTSVLHLCPRGHEASWTFVRG